MILFKKLPLLTLIFLSSCGNTPQRVYEFGAIEKFGDNLTIATAWNKTEEKFIIDFYKTNNQQEIFNFNMSTNNSEIVQEFKTDGMIITFDDGENVPFDENGEYKFKTSKTFFVSYKNFSERTKEILLNYSIDFHISYNAWIFDAKDYRNIYSK